MQIRGQVKDMQWWNGRLWAGIVPLVDYPSFSFHVPGAGLSVGQMVIIEVKEIEQ